MKIKEMLTSLIFVVQLFSLFTTAQDEQNAELYVEIGHNGPINSVIFSPDGSTIASASNESIKIWDATTGQELRTLNSSADLVIFAPDNETLISKEYYSGKIRLWNINTGNELKTIEERSNAVGMSPDGKIIATGDIYGNIKLRNFISGIEIKVFKGSKEPINSFAFSFDGKILASSSDDKTIKLWDTSSGKELKTLKDSTQEVDSLVFSKDNQKLASGSGNKIKIWEVVSGKLLKILDGKSAVSKSVVFSPDGQVIASGSNDSNDSDVEIWDIATGTQIKKFVRSARGLTGFVTSVAFSPDGKMLASGSLDNEITLFDVSSGQEVKKLTGQAVETYSLALTSDGQRLALGNSFSTKIWNITGKEKLVNTIGKTVFAVRSIAVSPDEKIIATGSSVTKDIRLYDSVSGQELRILTGHSSGIKYVVFSSDGVIIASASKDKTIKLWNVVSGKELKTLKGHTDYVNSVAFSPDGKLLVSGGNDNKVKLWNIADGIEIKSLAAKIGEIDSVAFSPDNKTIALGSGIADRLWDITSEKESKIFSHYTSSVRSINFLPDGSIIVSRDWNETAKLWNVTSGEEVQSFAAPIDSFNALAFSPDGSLLATSEKVGNVVKLFDAVSSKVIKIFTGHTDQINSIVFSPDGKTIASASNDKTVKLWEIDSGREIKTFSSDGSYFYSAAFSSDGKTLAGGQTQNSIKLWNIQSGKEVKTLKSTDSGYSSIYSITFSPNGKILATGDSEGLIKLWNVESGQDLKTFKGSDSILSSISSVVFSPDSKSLVSGDSENTIKLWNVESAIKLKSINLPMPKFQRKIFETVPDFYLKSQKTPTTADGKFQFRKSETGKINLYEVKTGRLLANMISLNDNDWVITTNDGRFDTNKSLDRIEGLHWIVNDEILKPLPLDVFLRQYYEPGLLRRVLRCNEENDCDKEFKLLPSIADINRVQPKVVIKEIKAANSTDLVDVTVEIENVTDDVSISATDRSKKKRLSSGVFDVRLFRDGQMIGNSTPTEKLASFYQAAPELIEKNKKYFAETKQLTNTPEDEAWRTANNLAEVKGVKFDGKSKYTYTFKNIKLPHDGRKEVEFTAYAFNADRVKSDNVIKTFPIPKTVANKPQPKRAFVIAFGVNKYQSSSWDLQFAANDARAMRGILADKLRKTGDFAEVVEIPLISDDETIGGKTLQRREATKQNVQTVLDLLAGKTPDEKRLKTLTAALGAETVGKIKPANPEDAVFISFSSHGYADRNGIFYILPTDIGANMPRTVTPELLKNSISSDELSLWLRDVDAGEMVMIVDACNAEAAVKNSEFKPAPMGSRGLGQLAYDKGMKILTATQAANVAIETGAIGHGLLTYALVGEGLGKENKADFRAADKTINLKEWLEYGEFRVPGLYDDLLNKRLKIVGKGTDVIDLSGDNSKQNSSSQTPVLFDFTKRRQELTLVRLP